MQTVSAVHFKSPLRITYRTWIESRYVPNLAIYMIRMKCKHKSYWFNSMYRLIEIDFEHWFFSLKFYEIWNIISLNWFKGLYNVHIYREHNTFFSKSNCSFVHFANRLHVPTTDSLERPWNSDKFILNQHCFKPNHSESKY